MKLVQKVDWQIRKQRFQANNELFLCLLNGVVRELLLAFAKLTENSPTLANVILDTYNICQLNKACNSYLQFYHIPLFRALLYVSLSLLLQHGLWLDYVWYVLRFGAY